MSGIEIKHGQASREMSRTSLRALDGHGDPGKFGRMFPGLPPLEVESEKLLKLAQAMKDEDPESSEGDNDGIEGGFTYLGQFVDHDITLDLTPLSDQASDPLATRNFRTPALDLDNVYGMGPQLAPYQYDRGPDGKQTGKLLIGKTEASRQPSPVEIPAGDHDLPRSRYGRAIIGDERNDENLLVSQTHLAFLKFHNKIVDSLPGDDALQKYHEARRLATWHYQWIVLYDFVERLTAPGLIDKIRHEGRKFYRFRTTPYIPVEFGAAAYRLGHSMVRESYNHNAVFSGADGAGPPGTLKLLFHFSGKSGGIVGDHIDKAKPEDFPNGPRPHERLPSNWVIDWNRFYGTGTSSGEGFSRNFSRKLDPFVVPTLHTLPGEDVARNEHILPFRNLLRGVSLELPSGQSIAKAMREKIQIDLLSAEDLSSGTDGAALKDLGLVEHTPLWFYILKEAQVVHHGKRLGPVGTQIVAETFLGLVHGDHNSFMWQRSDWKPTLPAAKDGHFTMVDMLNYIGELDPVGDALASNRDPEPAE